MSTKRARQLSRCRYCRLFVGSISQNGVCRLCWEAAGWVWTGDGFADGKLHLSARTSPRVPLRRAPHVGVLRSSWTAFETKPRLPN